MQKNDGEADDPSPISCTQRLRWNRVTLFTVCLTKVVRPDSDLLVGRYPVPHCKLNCREKRSCYS